LEATSAQKYSGLYGGKFYNTAIGGTEGPGKYAPAYVRFAPQQGVFEIEFFGMSDGPGGAYNWRGFGFSDQDPVLNPADPQNRIDGEKFLAGGIEYASNYKYKVASKNCRWSWPDCGLTNTSFQSLKWDHFKLIVDVPNQRYEIFVNGNSIGMFTFYRSVTSISRFLIYSEYKTVYIDDLDIYSTQ
jgi:hypothetical protein